MAKFGLNIAISDIDRSVGKSYELLPDGHYVLELSAIDDKTEGNYVSRSYTYEVQEPEEFKGQRVWDWIDLGIDGVDPTWKEDKGRARLSQLCDAIGYDVETEGVELSNGTRVLDDDEVLLYRQFLATVKRFPAGVSKAGKPFKASAKAVELWDPKSPKCPEGPSIFAHQPVIATEAPTPAPASAPAARPAAARPANDNAAPRAAGAKPWGKKAA